MIKKIRKRDGSVVLFQQEKITEAIWKAAKAVGGSDRGKAERISDVIIKKLEDLELNSEVKVLDFTPYDSDRKRTTALVQSGEEEFLISMGAPQVVQGFTKFYSEEMKAKFTADIKRAADNGYRVLAVAVKEGKSEEEKDMQMAGMLILADPLDEDAKETIKFINHSGIEIKMLTGDNRVIAERVARELSLGGRIVPREEMQEVLSGGADSSEFKGAAGFAEILPKDKFDIVECAGGGYIVAVTGDGPRVLGVDGI